jgi:hypothetical protein
MNLVAKEFVAVRDDEDGVDFPRLNCPRHATKKRASISRSHSARASDASAWSSSSAAI